jgi:hypothetical protein
MSILFLLKSISFIIYGCYDRLPQEEKISPSASSQVIFFLSVVIYHNTLNQRQYVLYYTECPSEGGIAGYGLSLQYQFSSGLTSQILRINIYILLTGLWAIQVVKSPCVSKNMVLS